MPVVVVAELGEARPLPPAPGLECGLVLECGCSESGDMPSVPFKPVLPSSDGVRSTKVVLSTTAAAAPVLVLPVVGAAVPPIGSNVIVCGVLDDVKA